MPSSAIVHAHFGRWKTTPSAGCPIGPFQHYCFIENDLSGAVAKDRCRWKIRQELYIIHWAWDLLAKEVLSRSIVMACRQARSATRGTSLPLHLVLLCLGLSLVRAQVRHSTTSCKCACASRAHCAACRDAALVLHDHEELHLIS